MTNSVLMSLQSPDIASHFLLLPTLTPPLLFSEYSFLELMSQRNQKPADGKFASLLGFFPQGKIEVPSLHQPLQPFGSYFPDFTEISVSSFLFRHTHLLPPKSVFQSAFYMCYASLVLSLSSLHSHSPSFFGLCALFPHFFPFTSLISSSHFFWNSHHMSPDLTYFKSTTFLISQNALTLQAYLRDIVSLIPNHLIKVSITIKWVT